MGSPTPPPLEPTEPTYSADFDWPTVKPSSAARILGEGNVGVRTIAFNSDGSHFAVACKFLFLLSFNYAEFRWNSWRNFGD